MIDGLLYPFTAMLGGILGFNLGSLRTGSR